ncbi:unnamed protein product [Kuraishia capsulata CBS 1993]|uniref:ER membrane protein complex subunit 3 n=1 Tax=Kuraishia capsulata CBS 1993 TaxID=1382522 RepID=W6MUM1_9ASCO|nr:uncharacterized protein KUCA_T00001720001 [Kuraishia capsulata CBS 1993]CDK25750.1 unnamed protein product [Kuraishia capsulata CBS 1993]
MILTPLFRQHLQQARNFRTNAAVISTKDVFKQKQKYLTEALRAGKFLKEDPSEAKKEKPVNPLSDPGSMDAIFGMAKGNMANFIPQTVIMWWVNYFFAGFVIMKLPFPLTIRFKSMLQNSIMTSDLDVRWVSSISWYFVNLMGLKSVYSLILQDNSLVDKMMAAQQQQGQPNISMPGGPTMDKMMKGEAENVQIVEFRSCLDGIEERLFKRFEISV